jgi:hypothetical protein
MVDPKEISTKVNWIKPKEPKHYPEPGYPYCNRKHRLVEIYDKDRNEYRWDCKICMKTMRQEEEKSRRESNYYSQFTGSGVGLESENI